MTLIGCWPWRDDLAGTRIRRDWSRHDRSRRNRSSWSVDGHLHSTQRRLRLLGDSLSRNHGQRDGSKRRRGKLSIQNRDGAVASQLHRNERSSAVAGKFHSEIRTRTVAKGNGQKLRCGVMWKGHREERHCSNIPVQRHWEQMLSS
jgi:hypothetical protein